MLFELLALFFGFIAFLGLSFFISVPLKGALVRLRANYTPVRLRLDTDDGLEPPRGLGSISYFGMLARVKRIEGWAGLFKGFWPTVLPMILTTAAISPFLSDTTAMRHGSYAIPVNGVVMLVAYGVASLVSIPFSILLNRAIVTPHKLGFFQLRKSLDVLFTERERRNPLVLFLTPGIVVTQFLSTIIVVYGLGFLRAFLLAATFGTYFQDVRQAIPLIIYLGCAVASVLVITPLEVIFVRLSIQKNFGESEAPTEAPEFDGIDEDVIELRSEDEDPYYGFIDCTGKIINEEGWRTLYRGWWITLMGLLLTTFGA